MIRYFLGVLKSSVRNHPPIFAGAAVRFRNSMVSVGGAGSLWVNASLITTPGKVGAAPSPCPGVPFITPLGRQLVASPQVFAAAASLTITKENPNPSGI